MACMATRAMSKWKGSRLQHRYAGTRIGLDFLEVRFSRSFTAELAEREIVRGGGGIGREGRMGGLEEGREVKG